MAEYAVAPMTEPRWRFDAQDFAKRLRDQWPSARIGINDVPGSRMTLHALIPLGSPRGELGVALSDSGQYVSLDPADPETAAEFVKWYVQQLPSQDPPIQIFTKDDWSPLVVTPATSTDDIVAHLTSGG